MILRRNKTVLSIFCHLSIMNPLQSVDIAIVLVLKIIDNAEKSSSSLS